MKEDDLVKCCRCKNKHLHSERIPKPKKGSEFTSIVCPRCEAESFYNLSEKERLTSLKNNQIT